MMDKREKNISTTSKIAISASSLEELRMCGWAANDRLIGFYTKVLKLSPMAVVPLGNYKLTIETLKIYRPEEPRKEYADN